jgi:isopentenyldiphosphate isomerase
MKPLVSDNLRELRRLREEHGFGWSLSQADLAALAAAWEPLVQPDRKDCSEDFAVARADGTVTGAAGPRWLFHLFGFCHRAAHVGLATPNGQVVLQRRAATKADWPDAWDMAVAGHVPQNDDGSPMSMLDGALKETEEELGLPSGELDALTAEGELVPVGDPYFSYEEDVRRNPPFHNAECRQVYAATLTAEGMARLKADFDELSGIYICSEREAWNLLAKGDVAGGLRYSLPRYLDWLAQRNAARNRKG